MIQQHTVSIGSHASGNSVDLVYYRVSGTKNAPSAYLQAGIHGAELQGNAVLELLLDYLEHNPPLGDIVLVPFANPFGTDYRVGEFSQGRFDPVTGENWNRLYWNVFGRDPECLNIAEVAESLVGKEPEALRRKFRSLLQAAFDSRQERIQSFGASLCAALQSLALEADSVLDLHCASHSPRHLYFPAYAASSVPHFRFPFTLEIPQDFDGALDEAIFHPWWRLATELEKHCGKFQTPFVEAYTLELGAHEAVDFLAAKRDLASILSYLTARGTLAAGEREIRDSWLRPEERSIAWGLADYRTIYAPEGGLIEWCVAPGQAVKAGDCLAKIHQWNRRAGSSQSLKVNQIAVESPQAGYVVVRHSSGSIRSGMELVKLATRTRYL